MVLLDDDMRLVRERLGRSYLTFRQRYKKSPLRLEKEGPKAYGCSRENKAGEAHRTTPSIFRTISAPTLRWAPATFRATAPGSPDPLTWMSVFMLTSTFLLPGCA